MLTFDRVFQVCLAACDCAALVALQLQWRGEFGSRGVAPAADAVRKVRRLVASVRAAEDAAEPPQPVPPPPQQQPPPPPRSGVERTWQFFAMSALRLAADALAPHWRAARRAARDLRLGLSLAPTAFLVTGASDRALLGAFAAGYVAIALLATGVAPVAGALLFAAVHASFTTVAQPWLGLQFEPLLVESNAVFAVGYAFRAAAPWLWTTLLRWLTFRLMFAAGAGKLSSGDPAWRDGRAMAYHYMTQPLPNALSRFMHRLPRAWHNFETAATFLFEGPLALTFFSSHRALRWAGFLGTAAFNAAIAATGKCVRAGMRLRPAPVAGGGATLPAASHHPRPFLLRQPPRSYGHLHILTVTDALAIVADTSSCASSGGGKTAAPSQTSWLAVSCPPPPATWLGWGASWLLWAAGLAVGAAYVAVSLVPFTSNFSGLVSLELSVPGWERLEAAYAAASRWHVVGAYNLFATMTRFRWELQLEGTADGGATWHPFGYWHKPGGGPESLDDRPRTLPLGFFLRTDWCVRVCARRRWWAVKCGSSTPLPLRCPFLPRVPFSRAAAQAHVVPAAGGGAHDAAGAGPAGGRRR